jgi:hypothetical protein
MTKPEKFGAPFNKKSPGQCRAILNAALETGRLFSSILICF